MPHTVSNASFSMDRHVNRQTIQMGGAIPGLGPKHPIYHGKIGTRNVHVHSSVAIESRRAGLLTTNGTISNENDHDISI